MGTGGGVFHEYIRCAQDGQGSRYLGVALVSPGHQPSAHPPRHLHDLARDGDAAAINMVALDVLALAVRHAHGSDEAPDDVRRGASRLPGPLRWTRAERADAQAILVRWDGVVFGRNGRGRGRQVRACLLFLDMMSQKVRIVQTTCRRTVEVFTGTLKEGRSRYDGRSLVERGSFNCAGELGCKGGSSRIERRLERQAGYQLDYSNEIRATAR